MYLSNSTDYYRSFSDNFFHLCMCIKNFWFTEGGNDILKIKERRGGWFECDV